MKDYWKEAETKKINKKKIIIATTIAIIVIALIATSILYINNKQARNWIDKNIFRKEKIY